MLNTLQSYKERKSLNEKNVYLDRIIKANHDVFMEAMSMSAALKEAILEGADKYGWLDDRIKIREDMKAKEIARKLLLQGVSIEKVAEATDLSIDEVTVLI